MLSWVWPSQLQCAKTHAPESKTGNRNPPSVLEKLGAQKRHQNVSIHAVCERFGANLNNQTAASTSNKLATDRSIACVASKVLPMPPWYVASGTRLSPQFSGAHPLVSAILHDAVRPTRSPPPHANALYPARQQRLEDGSPSENLA